MSFSENYQYFYDELKKACAASGRNVADVKLVAVSKTVGVPEIQQAIAAGLHDFGENRPDCLQEKAEALPNEAWHFIGNIQSRKIPEIVKHSSMVHSLFKESHLAKFDAAAKEIGKVQDVLLEVNVSGEESKSGLEPGQVRDVLLKACEFENIRVCGLMTMAPFAGPGPAMKTFKGLRELRDTLKSELDAQHAKHFNELSMGMSSDWLQGVIAGATIIRVGRALFTNEFRR